MPVESYEQKNKNFAVWFFSTNQLQEKLWSFIVLFVEIFLLFTSSLGKNSILIALLFNLFFLIYFIVSFKKHFKLGFSIENHDAISQFKSYNNSDSVTLDKYERRANEAIFQFRNFRGFLYATAILYLLLLLARGEDFFYQYETAGLDFFELHHVTKYYLTLVIHLVSYAGAVYVLKCFYIMHFPTFKDGEISTLERTDTAWIIVVVLIVLEAIFTYPFHEPLNPGKIQHSIEVLSLIFEVICSIANAIILILLFARFESRLLGINPFVILILYFYAICQTTLPIVTDSLGIFCPGSTLSGDNEAYIRITTLILTLCLLGKIIFYNIVVYLYQTKRLFYYFIITTLIYHHENEYWNEFEKHTNLE